MKFTPKFGLPVIKPYRGSVDFEFVAFDKRKNADRTKSAIHFFGSDNRIVPPITTNLAKTTTELVMMSYKANCM